MLSATVSNGKMLSSKETFCPIRSRERPSKREMIGSTLKKCNDDEFAGKQQCIINISAQLGFLILTSLQRRVYIAAGSMLKYPKKPISDST